MGWDQHRKEAGSIFAEEYGSPGRIHGETFYRLITIRKAEDRLSDTPNMSPNISGTCCYYLTRLRSGDTSVVRIWRTKFALARTSLHSLLLPIQIGRASCRERVCQYV